MSTDMFHTLDEANVRGKRVLVRVDLNVPLENGKVTDTTRIERVVPTIREIADKGGKVILLSHFGRPKGPDPAQSLKLLMPAIAAVLKRPVALRCCRRADAPSPHSAKTLALRGEDQSLTVTR